MQLVVLNVAYPFSPVGPEVVGSGAQVAQLDAALVRGGHESIVMACEGSTTDGILLATRKPTGAPDEMRRHSVHEQYRFTLGQFLEKWPIDLIHFHGEDFYEYLPGPGIPVLITLHSPAASYPDAIFRLDRPQTFLHCVSNQQRSSCPPCQYLLPEIESGQTEQYLALYEHLVRDAREAEAALRAKDAPAAH